MFIKKNCNCHQTIFFLIDHFRKGRMICLADWKKGSGINLSKTNFQISWGFLNKGDLYDVVCKYRPSLQTIPRFSICIFIILLNFLIGSYFLWAGDLKNCMWHCSLKVKWRFTSVFLIFFLDQPIYLIQVNRPPNCPDFCSRRPWKVSWFSDFQKCIRKCI